MSSRATTTQQAFFEKNVQLLSSALANLAEALGNIDGKMTSGWNGGIWGLAYFQRKPRKWWEKQQEKWICIKERNSGDWVQVERGNRWHRGCNQRSWRILPRVNWTEFHLGYGQHPTVAVIILVVTERSYLSKTWLRLRIMMILNL